MPTHAKVYISLVSAAGIAALAYAFLDPPWTHDAFRLGTYLLLALLAATLKLRLPGLTGTMSIGFVFALIGISEFPLPETMLIACAPVVVQCLWRAKQRPAFVQVLFSVAAVSLSVALADEFCRLIRATLHTQSISIAMSAATCAYFVANSMLVSGVLSLVKKQPLRAVWQQCYLCSFPYYLAGGVIAGMVAASSRELGWQPPLMILPVMGLVFLFYRFYLSRIEVPAGGMQAMKAGSA